MPWIPLAAAGVAAGGAIAGGIIAKNAQSGAREDAAKYIDASVQDLQRIGIPPWQAFDYAIEDLKSQGKLTPEMEQTFRQQSSEMNNIQTDPRLKQAQTDALGQLQDIGKSGGMRLSDKAAEEQALGQVSARERGARGAIEMDLKQRHGYGSGAELADKLQNEQAAATSANQIGLNTAASAQDRALQAIMQGGQLGGQMQGQAFDQASRIAAANDAINRFNTQNSQTVANTNTGARNYAQEKNLSEAQRINDTNTNLHNTKAAAVSGLKRTQYEDELRKAGTLANIRTGQAADIRQAGKDNAAMWGQVGSGVGQAGTAVGSYYADQQKQASDKLEKQKDRDAYGYGNTTSS